MALLVATSVSARIASGPSGGARSAVELDDPIIDRPFNLASGLLRSSQTRKRAQTATDTDREGEENSMEHPTAEVRRDTLFISHRKK